MVNILIDRMGLDVSSLDNHLRVKTVKELRDHIYLAKEYGASNIAFVTGPDPGEEKRQDGMDALYESFCSIAEEAEKYNMNVLVEHLDRFAHKKRLLGPIDESVHLIARVQKEHKNVGLAFDTAHSALNGENVVDAIQVAKPYVQQIHFSNAVLNPKSELYGDHHMQIGQPGFLDNEKIINILKMVDELEVRSESGLRVAVESRTLDKEKLEDSALRTKKILEKSLKSLMIKR